MGILGLLPLLKDIQVKTSVSSFKGQTVGVDAYCWLHKGTYGCAKDVVLGQPTKVYIQYVMRRVNMLINFNITPILVFDGGHLPAKSEKEKERREKRKEFRTRALEALRNGNMQEAFESFQKCCDITPEMAANVIQACSELNVMCIVAPYEADAQLAFLMKSGITQLTISEDSDLLLYGCNKVLYKMSAEGDGMLVDIDNLAKVRSVQLSSFTLDNFRQMCMLSGCDYLPSIKGLGLKKAHQALKRHSNIKQCIRSFKCNPQYSVPDDYEENFRKAELVFKYQLVFDPIRKCIVPLNVPEEELSLEDTIYCGPKLTDDLALNIALGNIDPISHKRLLNLRDFATGNFSSKNQSQNFGSQKSQGWLAASKESSKFQRKHVNKASNLALQADEFQESDASFDLTPENSNSNQNKKAVKNLEGSLLKAETLKSEASKSLKRLRSPEDSPVKGDKWVMLYEKDKVSTENQSVRTNHHSVFNVNKNLHKFKNPFRQDNYKSQHLTKSRYFSSNMQQVEPKNVEKMIEEEKLVEPLLFEMYSGDSSQVNEVKLKSTLNNQFQSISDPKQRKLEFVITPSLFEGSASALNKNLDTLSEDNSISSNLNERVNCESLSKIDSFGKSDAANLSFKNLNQSKIVSQPHITKMLNSFKRTEAKLLVNESTDQIIMDAVDLTDEEPLSNFFKLQAEKVSLSSGKRPHAFPSLSRCKSVGLSRSKIKKGPQHPSKLNTSNISKQTKIMFDKFAFRRSLNLEPKDVLCTT